MTWLETSSEILAGGERVEHAPQLGPQHRVEPDGRLVEDEELGDPSSATASETRER